MKYLIIAASILAMTATAQAGQEYGISRNIFGSKVVYTGTATPEDVAEYVNDGREAIADLVAENPAIGDAHFFVGSGVLILIPSVGNGITMAMMRDAALALKSRHLWVAEVRQMNHAGTVLVRADRTPYFDNGGRSRFYALRGVETDMNDLRRR